MPSKPEYPIDDEHVLRLIVNSADIVFGRIYRVRDRVYREKGIVTAYWHPADAEMWCAHWRAECYISPKSFSDSLMEGIGKQLMANTVCKEPLHVHMCFGERTDDSSKSFGQVLQPIDDD